MVHEVELRLLIACQRHIQNIIKPGSADAAADEAAASGASGDDYAEATSSSSSAAPSKKRKRSIKKEQDKEAKKAKVTSDFKESGPSAAEFCEAVHDAEDDLVVLKLVIVALKSRIKKLRKKNYSRLDAIHHVAALTIARATGINSCVALPRVKYQGGWKTLLRRSTTGSYMQLMALSRFTMILSRKLHRFGTKLIAPDETYTSKTCLSCRIVKPRSADRTFKCSDCKLHTHRDITSSSNIAIRSIGLGEMALRGIMVA
jgi:transposase